MAHPERSPRWTTVAALFMATLGAVSTVTVPASASPSRHHHGRRHTHVDLAAYRARVRVWHDGARVPMARHTEDGRLVLRLVSLNTRAVAEVTPSRPEGGFSEGDFTAVARVMEDSRTHTVAPVDRRLVEVLYELARHFDAGQVTVVSGYRAESRRSNHQLGRAIDVVMPGVSDEALASYARTVGMLGVGVYPTGGFVHVDVRTSSWYWVDRSGPGRSRRLHEIHGDIARRADAEARARGVVALGGTASGTAGTTAPEDGTVDEDSAAHE